MKLRNNNKEVFLYLTQTGLWRKASAQLDINLDIIENADWEEVYRLAQEQSLQGLVLQGIEELKAKGIELSVPKVLLLQWIGEVQVIEQRNKEMNAFIANLIGMLRKHDIYALLMKGQGIAQCYEKPLWRSCGDVDLYLCSENYEKAKAFLIPMALHIGNEDKRRLHLGMTIDDWVVELHGAMYKELSQKMDIVSDEVHNDIFLKDNVRIWDNNGVLVFLPNIDNDVIIIFNHFINHFFLEGVGLRQICDWCRLLYTYRDSLDYELLEKRIKKMSLMSEWKAFAALAVDYLGMPIETMPFYDAQFKNKGEKVLRRVLKIGNFGHNNDLSYRVRYSGMTYKIVAMWRRLLDFTSLIPVFPLDAPRFFVTYLFNKVK